MSQKSTEPSQFTSALPNGQSQRAQLSTGLTGVTAACKGRGSQDQVFRARRLLRHSARSRATRRTPLVAATVLAVGQTAPTSGVARQDSRSQGRAALRTRP